MIDIECPPFSKSLDPLLLYVTKSFWQDLVVIRKSKVTLTLKKPAYVGMCILDLSKVLVYEFHYDYIKNKYGNNSGLLFTFTDSLTYDIKTEDVDEDFSKHKDMSDFSNYSVKSKYSDDSNKLVWQGKRSNSWCCWRIIEEFVGLNLKMCSFLVDDNNEHKKVKFVNKNVVETISHNEWKDVLLNQKFLRHSMNRIQGKNNRIGTYEINKISLFYFDDKMHILNSGYDGFTFSF